MLVCLAAQKHCFENVLFKYCGGNTAPAAEADGPISTVVTSSMQKMSARG